MAQAQGEAQRFVSVYEAFRKAPDVTRRRLYLETMEQILRESNKYIMPDAAGTQGVVPYLPLSTLPRPAPQPQSPPAQPAPAQPSVSNQGSR